MKPTATYSVTLRPAGTLFPAGEVRHESRLFVLSSDGNGAWGDSIG